MSGTKHPIRRWLIAALKLALFAVVAVFIWRSIQRAHSDMAAKGFSLSQVNPWWLAASGVLYLVAQIPMAWFWQRTMRAMGQHPSSWDTLRAYLIGGLGKYVPGKAMVLVLRTGMVRNERVDTTVAALCVFVETLTYMAVGGFMGALLVLFMAFSRGDLWFLVLIAVGMMAGTGIPILPPIFRRVVYVLRVKRANADIDTLLERLTWKVMAQGWVAMSLAWLIMGLSLWTAVKAVPASAGLLGSPLVELPLLTAAVALAVVAGFLSMLPGGVGVREWVLSLLMVPHFGDIVSIVSVILLRLSWLLAEVLVSGILYLMGRRIDRDVCSGPPRPINDLPAETKAR